MNDGEDLLSDSPGEGIDRHRLTDLFSLLSDQYVRYTLAYVSGRQAITLNELTEFVTGREATDRGVIARRSDYERVRIRLYHVVLPRLDEAGYVEFDSQTCTITGVAIPPIVDRLLALEE